MEPKHLLLGHVLQQSFLKNFHQQNLNCIHIFLEIMKSNQENIDHTLITLSCVLAVLTLSLAVVAILVVKR